MYILSIILIVAVFIVMVCNVNKERRYCEIESSRIAKSIITGILNPIGIFT